MKKIRVLEYSVCKYSDEWQKHLWIQFDQLTLGTLTGLFTDFAHDIEKLKEYARTEVDFGSNSRNIEIENNKIIITDCYDYNAHTFITNAEQLIFYINEWYAIYQKKRPYMLIYRALDETVHFIGYDREEDIPIIEHDKSYIEKIIAEKKREARYTVTYSSTLPLARIFGIDVIGMALPPEEEETYYFEGYHSNYNGGLVKDGKIQLLEETRKTHPSGAYMIDIVVNGVRKKRTFFPDGWSPTILCKKVDEACHNTTISIVTADMHGAGVLPKITLDGIVIKTILNKDNTKIVNVYPDEKMFI